MYFADLDLCRYHSGPFDAGSWSVSLHAVGWLERLYRFNTGAVPSAGVCNLNEMLEQMCSAYFHYGFRGLHVCSLCQWPGASSSALPGLYINVFVPGANVFYVAPAGIIHYIERHSYLPPQEFLEAVLRCPDCTTIDYREALSTANGGREIPL